MTRRARRRGVFYEDRVEERNGFKWILLESGRPLSFLDVHSMAEAGHSALATAVSRMFKLVNGNPEYGDDDLERIEWFLDNVETYLGAMRKELARRRGTRRVEDRIALLRNTDGRTPEEAEAFLRKADELERRRSDGS